MQGPKRGRVRLQKEWYSANGEKKGARTIREEKVCNDNRGVP